MIRLAIQFLEPGPHIATVTPAFVAARLRQAFAALPFDALMLGWNLPRPLIDAAAEETARAGVALYLWHPLLAGDGRLDRPPQWHTIGLDGAPVPGHAGMQEFTFVCPNRADVRDAVLAHLSEVVTPGLYTGIFLDKIRWPSPATDPASALACFCPACQEACTAFDLEEARRQVAALADDPSRARAYMEMVVDPRPDRATDAATHALYQVMEFRTQSISAVITTVTALMRTLGLAVGLDCFTPGLAPLVGQDLAALAPHGDWIKTMSYGHTLGPAGIPFEVLGLLDWLVDRHGVPEPDAIATVSGALGWSLPASRTALRHAGVSSTALATEVASAKRAGVGVHLFGIELNDIAGVAHLNDDQIRADLAALRAAAPAGLILSWDLYHIPQARLDLVRAAYLQD